ncbi:MAG: cation:proton antiporter [bacterium]|nr:cation:proton antiporter [bacterium]
MELAAIVCVAAVFGFIARLLKQPVILAYLATGVALGFVEFLDVKAFEPLSVFSDLGVMFLLFLVGLEINYTSLRLVGKQAAIAGLGQVFFTFILGYILAKFFGLASLTAAYVSIALTFSSTIIIVKLLSDKRDLGSLYGKMSLGILLVQDLVAILILVVLSGVQNGVDFSPLVLFFTLFKALLLFVIVFWLGRLVFPLLFDKISHSHELLFLMTLAWVFLLAGLVRYLGFSVEIAGFLAGLALANSSEHYQIAAKIRPLRDFFLLIFFVLLGSQMILSNFTQILWPIAVFSAFVLIGNPLIVMVIMGLMGYRKRTSFLTGVSIAQISEFSLVLMALGLKLGHVDETAVTLVTSVGVLTIVVSSYLILHGDALYRFMSPMLALFERKSPHERHMPPQKFSKPIVVIGYHRTGQGIVKALPKKDVLVIDFDPEVARDLRENGYDHIFGDIADTEVFELANLARARLVISTSPGLDDNLILLNFFRHLRRRPKIVLRAENEKDAEILYEQGANYVLVPHISSGHYLGKLLAEDPELKFLKKLRGQHV